MTELDLNAGVESPCHRTGEWGFAVYLTDGTAVPVGVFSDWGMGAAAANACMRSYGARAEKWVGQPLYKELRDEPHETVVSPCNPKPVC